VNSISLLLNTASEIIFFLLIYSYPGLTETLLKKRQNLPTSKRVRENLENLSSIWKKGMKFKKIFVGFQKLLVNSKAFHVKRLRTF
jgi:hypothetical protein